MVPSFDPPHPHPTHPVLPLTVAHDVGHLGAVPGVGR
jgi:hypothetical protein